MIKFDDVVKEDTKKHNPNWPEIPDYPYRVFIFGGSESVKKSSLFNQINQQPDTDKMYLFTEYRNKAKYQFLIKKREDVGTKHFNDLKAVIEYSNHIVDIYKNIEDYNPNKKRKILIAFDDMIADMLSNKKCNSVVTELFNRGRKLNISIVFITQSYFVVLKVVD